ncbi:MAG TPA: maleylpyruvate isomerase family mycothiol-dependent enzyme, partial [Chloroflexota bacterium]
MNVTDRTHRTIEADPRRWIAALRRSQDRLASLVEPLTPVQLRGPSYHDWTIAQVLGHMGSQAEIFMGWVTAALDGTEPAGQDFMQPIWDAWDARSPAEQAADSIAYNERFVERLEGLTDNDLARMHLNLFGMELDASGLPRLRLAEHALHSWDIAVALDPTTQLAPDAVALLIDTLGPLAGRVGKPQNKAFQLHVRTSDPQ